MFITLCTRSFTLGVKSVYAPVFVLLHFKRVALTVLDVLHVEVQAGHENPHSLRALVV